MYNFQTTKDAPKDSMLSVQPRCCCCGNEELRAVRVRSSVGHRNRIRTTLMSKCAGIENTHRSCFRDSENSSSNSLPQIEVPPVPSPSGSPVWIICIPQSEIAGNLQDPYKFRDYTVEHHVLVVARPCVACKILNSSRGMFRE